MTWTNKRSFYSLLIILECLGDGGGVTHCERISKFVQKSFESRMQKVRQTGAVGRRLLFSAKYRNLLECVTMTWTNKRSFYSLLIILECLGGGGGVTRCERISKFVQSPLEPKNSMIRSLLWLSLLTKYAHWFKSISFIWNDNSLKFYQPRLGSK